MTYRLLIALRARSEPVGLEPAVSVLTDKRIESEPRRCAALADGCSSGSAGAFEFRGSPRLDKECLMSIVNDPIRAEGLARPVAPGLSRDAWLAEPVAVAAAGDPNGDRQYNEFADAMNHAQRIRYAMAVTRGQALDARPLTTQAADPDGVIWFFVPAESELNRDIAEHPDLLLVYADTDSGRYLSVNGRASLVIDVERTRRLWSSVDETFFPGGPTDPNLRLLRVDVSRLELWEPKGTRLGQFLKMAAAAMGKPVSQQELGHHEVLNSPRG